MAFITAFKVLTAQPRHDVNQIHSLIEAQTRNFNTLAAARELRHTTCHLVLEPTEKFLILFDISLIFIGAIFATTVNKTIWAHSFYYLQNIIVSNLGRSQVSNGPMGRIFQHHKNRCTNDG